MSKRIVIGNWKMNPQTKKEAEKIFKGIAKEKNKKVEVVICPPAIYLESMRKISKSIPLGVQNMNFENIGPFTGELGASMLYDLGARFVILGHSERRALGETNKDVNKKIKSAFYNGLQPVLCVGESVRDAEHKYLSFVKEQLEQGLEGISKNSIEKLIIAYEPVWAIGEKADREATPEEFLETSIFIRKILSDKFGNNFAQKVRIIYGGSVHPENALGFVVLGRSEGFLVGRDSLYPKKFLEIINCADNA